MTITTPSTDNFADELQAFKLAIDTKGIYGALRFLNSRTPHRYSGIYRYDGNKLLNIGMYDKYDPNTEKGEDAPLSATYCSLLKKRQTLEVLDVQEDARLKGIIITPVLSYCGVLIKDEHGNPFGSLCHFDMKRCQERTTDFPLLESAANLIYQYIKEEKEAVPLVAEQL
ncbi:hypothetical protein FVR03_01905 [Pontibacter qinzhouensis]|uniref:GAF domain-containing protein n=1 Tax=Pontibacter qinzhouensis TaxID=2603253 RepID=A0A5C8KE25_9BACT|nr:hypothetical protein [Pontibacter qinzhouensis]TXK52198.1 hypothetical protein FVR03_01905 [Pontibacter qinzhouensis]